MYTAAMRRGAMPAVQSKELLMKQFLLLMKCERLRLCHTHGNRKNKGIEEENCFLYPREQKQKGIEKENCFLYPREQKKQGHRERKLLSIPTGTETTRV